MRNRILLIVLAAAIIAAAVSYWFWGRPEVQAGSSRVEDRARAAESLRGRSDDSSVKTLRILVMDPEPKVALRAIRSMAGEPSEQYRQILVSAMSESKSGRVRGEAAAVLGAYAQTPPQALVEVLQKDSDPHARAGAAQGLQTKKDDRQAIASLVAALDDPDQEVRVTAINSLNRIVGGGIRFNYQAQAPAEQRRQQIRGVEIILRNRKLL